MIHETRLALCPVFETPVVIEFTTTLFVFEEFTISALSEVLALEAHNLKHNLRLKF